MRSSDGKLALPFSLFDDFDMSLLNFLLFLGGTTFHYCPSPSVIAVVSYYGDTFESISDAIDKKTMVNQVFTTHLAVSVINVLNSATKLLLLQQLECNN